MEVAPYESFEEAKDRASKGTGVVAGSFSSVKKYGEGALASGGSSSSSPSSEAIDGVVVTESMVSNEVRRRRCKGRRLSLR